MDVFWPVEFTGALSWLQGRIGREVSVSLNHHGHFFGCGLRGELQRVETLPPDDVAIRIVVGAGEGLFLDPEDVTALIGGEAGGRSWLEFQTVFGPVVTVEVVDRGPS
ncbi:MAG: hypothetical protein R2909_20200 [Gemmatimonadales bacterium]